MLGLQDDRRACCAEWPLSVPVQVCAVSDSACSISMASRLALVCLLTYSEQNTGYLRPCTGIMLELVMTSQKS